ncbi:MAG: hypothetical protein R3D34_06760 [Nitratireductor sp.]
MSFDEHLTEDARLIILKELARQGDYRLNDMMLMKVLDAMGHRRSRDWLMTQLGKIAELGAVKLAHAGDITVAQITQAGIDHVERRSFLAGVARPSPEA